VNPAFRVLLLLGLQYSLSLLATSSLLGQQPEPAAGPIPEMVSGPEDPSGQAVVDGYISPGGAFLRSVIVPGWGHVATGSYVRGGFYVAVQTASLWGLWQTMDRRAQASEYRALERQLVAARIKAGGGSSPESIQTEVDRDPSVQNREALVEARDQQVEDWTALSIFLVLLGGVDAFVAAHLSDYPEPLTLRVLPVGADGVEIQVSLPMNRLPIPGLWGR
jgi:hypothetical protein